MLAVGNLKTCSSCRKILQTTEFFKNRCAEDGLANLCKPCKATATKNWKYGLESGWTDQTIQDQVGKCLICKLPAYELVIDHDHITGRIRGLLCRKCNALLGMCQDSPYILENAIKYLQTEE